MTNNHYSDRIRDFILERFPLARRRGVTLQDSLLEGGILDSLGILDVVAFIEQHFALVLTDDELTPENFQSIECIAAFVQSKISSEVNKQP